MAHAEPTAAAEGAEAAVTPAAPKPTAVTSGKKKKKSGQGAQAPAVPFTVRISQTLAGAKTGLLDVLRSTGSDDQPTRRMSALFLASLVCAAVVLGAVGERYYRYRKAKAQVAAAIKKEESNFSEFLRKQSELAHQKTVMLTLGQFALELRGAAGESRPARGVMNLAEIEIVVECDSKETHDFLEQALTQTRNQVTDVLVAMDRGELLSPDGKARLKRRLIEKLNAMLTHGKVENLYFSKLVLT